MLDYKVLLGVLSVLILLLGYGMYLRQIFVGKVKSHVFSWLIWGVMNGVVFLAQFLEGAGPGAWVTGFSVVTCFLVFALTLTKGDREFDKIDWILLGSAFLSMLLWGITNQPLPSVILVTIADAFGTFLIIRKACGKPFEESAVFFALNTMRAFISLFAIESYSLVTWLFPAYLVVGNALIVLVVLWRRAIQEDSSKNS